MEALTDDDKAVLRKAADEILRRGITRGAYFDDHDALTDCRVCAVGALAAAAADPTAPIVGLDIVQLTPGGDRILEALSNALPDDYGKLCYPEGRITRWSDEPGRTAEEVAELFLNVADNY